MKYHGEENKQVMLEEKYPFLCVTRRQSEEREKAFIEANRAPVTRWHQAIQGDAILTVYGVQIGDHLVPVRSTVRLAIEEKTTEDREYEVLYFRTGLSGGVHSIGINIPEDEDDVCDVWDLYLNALTEKGKQRGDEWGTKDELPKPTSDVDYHALWQRDKIPVLQL
jgi:hypothetical protein